MPIALGLGIAKERLNQVNKPHFHLDPSVSIGHIGTTVALLVGLLWWGASIDRRIELNAQSIDATQQWLEREIKRADASDDRMRDSLARIEAKLDRYIENSPRE